MQSSFHVVNGFLVPRDPANDTLQGTTQYLSQGEGPGIGKGEHRAQEVELCREHYGRSTRQATENKSDYASKWYLIQPLQRGKYKT